MKKTSQIDHLICPAEWAKATGRSVRSVDALIGRGVIPPPDLRILGRPKWRASTYEATLKRWAAESLAAADPQSADLATALPAQIPAGAHAREVKDRKARDRQAAPEPPRRRRRDDVQAA